MEYTCSYFFRAPVRVLSPFCVRVDVFHGERGVVDFRWKRRNGDLLLCIVYNLCVAGAVVLSAYHRHGCRRSACRATSTCTTSRSGAGR